MDFRAHVRKSDCPSPATRSPRSISIGILLTGLSSSGPSETPATSVAKRTFRTASRIPGSSAGSPDHSSSRGPYASWMSLRTWTTYRGRIGGSFPRLVTAGREDRRPAERRGLDALPTVGERPVDELLHLRLEVRGAGRLLRRQERPGLVAHQGARRMKQEAVVDQIAGLRFDADDRRVGRLMLAVVERPRVMDLEIEVHRPGLLRLQAELERDLLVRLDLLDRPESDDLHGSGDDGRDVLGRPVPLVRDVHLEAVPAVRLQPGVRRLEEQPRITVLQESLDPRLRGHLGPLDEGLGPFQVLEAHRLFRLQQERLDVGEVRVDGVRLHHRVPDPFQVGARPLQDRPPALAGERFFRPPEVLLHLSRVLLLDRALDLREVRLRLPDIQVLALPDRDVVDQGRELDLDFLRGDLALLPFEGFVEALMDLPDALVLAFVV